MYKIFQKDNVHVYAGVVEAVEKHERNGVPVMVVTLKDYADERIKIYFRNNDTDKLADRVVNAKIESGTFLAVRALCNDPEEKTATGVDFRREGAWELKVNDGSLPVTILLGPAIDAKDTKNGDFQITVTVPAENHRKNYIKVFFKDEENRKRATFARKVLYNQEKPFVIIVGGRLRTNDYNGKPSMSMTGWKVTRK